MTAGISPRSPVFAHSRSHKYALIPENYLRIRLITYEVLNSNYENFSRKDYAYQNLLKDVQIFINKEFLFLKF